MRPGPTVLLLALIPIPAAGDAGEILERVNESRTASGLGARSCESEGGLDSWFRYRPGSPYVAELAVALPVPFEQVVPLVADLQAYPSWLLLDRDVSPTLGDFVVEPDGSAKLFLDDDGDEALEGTVETLRTEDAVGLRLRAGLDGPIKRASLEAAAFRRSGCVGQTLVVIRADWKLGMLARLFGGAQKGIPALLLLGVRADLVAATVHDPATVLELLDETLELERRDGAVRKAAAFEYEGTVIIPASAPVVRILPSRIQVVQERFAAIDPVLRRLADNPGKVDSGRLFAGLFAALDGRHRLVGFTVAFETDDGMRYQVSGDAVERSFGYLVMPGEEGLSLSVFR